MDLVARVARMPQTVAHDFTGSGLGVDELQLNTSFCHGPEGFRFPISLQHLFPHHRVKLPSVLVREHEAHVVVVDFRVDEERTLEVYSIKTVQTLKNERLLI